MIHFWEPSMTRGPDPGQGGSESQSSGQEQSAESSYESSVANAFPQAAIIKNGTVVRKPS